MANNLFKKIVTRYKSIGYNMDILRQNACMVVNPIMVDNIASGGRSVLRLNDGFLLNVCQMAGTWC